jgi:DNA-binding GntR family transcriptional regulator
MAAAVEKAYHAIREGIVSGAFSPGSHLTAQDLASATGLSRTPVREAMRRLHAEGLIKFIPHRGAFVRTLDEQEVIKVYDVVVLLESLAAQACAQNATPAQIAELDGMVAEMEDMVAARKSASEIAAVNTTFHRLIVAAADNSWLQASFSIIVEVPQLVNTFRGYQLEELQRSQAQHVELMMAFKAHDSNWAHSIMTSHVMAARHVLVREVAAGNIPDPIIQVANSR